MAHKTLINGTSYNVVGGSTLVNNTSYNIVKGKTLIGGTSYSIVFGSGGGGFDWDGLEGQAWAEGLVDFLANNDETTIKATIPVGATKTIDNRGIRVIGRCQDGEHTLTFQTTSYINFSTTIDGYYASVQNNLPDFSTYFPTLVDYVVPTTRREFMLYREKSSGTMTVRGRPTFTWSTWFRPSFHELGMASSSYYTHDGTESNVVSSNAPAVALESQTVDTVSCQVGKQFIYEYYDVEGDRRELFPQWTTLKDTPIFVRDRGNINVQGTMRHCLGTVMYNTTSGNIVARMQDGATSRTAKYNSYQHPCFVIGNSST